MQLRFLKEESSLVLVCELRWCVCRLMHKGVLALSKAAPEERSLRVSGCGLFENAACKAGLPFSLISAMSEKHQMPYFTPVQLTLF